MKISRVIILAKSFVAEIRQIINPKEIITVRLNDAVVDKKTLDSTRIYVAAYMILLCLFTLVISLDGLDFTTNFTAVAATLNNIGPGLGQVGPAENFTVYSQPAKYVLMFDMLAGRLELFPILLLFTPATWKRR